DTHVQGNRSADESWYYDHRPCMKLRKEGQERKYERKRRAKVTSTKHVEEEWKKCSIAKISKIDLKMKIMMTAV
ncbi:hypothetical protein Tco_1111510, partial [Tanacetum coccineum]